MLPRASIPTGILSALLFIALAALSGNAYAASHLWAPVSIPAEDLADRTTLLYEGMAGRLVLASPEVAADLATRGSQSVSVGEGEALYVFFCEDAQVAQFEPPVRVLVRDGREVLLATQGETPRLTPESAAAMWGMKRPVRITGDAIPWILTAQDPLEAPDRSADPLIESMVASMTEASFMPTWQTLEDFVTRYTLAPENTQSSQWMLEQFQSYGLDAEFHYYNQNGQRRNVVATHPGVVNPDKVVYLVGHFDAISNTPYVCAPGADDNASGTAAVLEAARIMSQYMFDHTIKFVAFNGEEQGLLGSAAYCGDIYNQGEDVVGAFNMDMIAYRGYDPYPPDMIIYTNTNSQSLAAILRQATLTYTPGLLDPVVIVQNMNASDHGSFWARGWKAVCAIQEEAWGSDFNPWYHTCEDLIWRYPTDYVVHCSQANMAAAAVTAGPISPDGPFLVLRSTMIDDDDVPPSQGDGDGTLNPGEIIELWVTVENVGTSTATAISGSLAVAAGDASIVTGSASWANIPAGNEGTNSTPFVFEIDGAATDGSQVSFTLALTDDHGSRDLNFSFPIIAPRVAYYFHSLDDATAAGNANGVLDPGEVLDLNVMVTNTGGKDAAGIEIQLASGSGNLTVVNGSAAAGAVPVGAVVEVPAAFRITASPDAIEGEILIAHLTAEDPFGYTSESVFKLMIGAAFFDDIEEDGAWSLEDPDDTATTGRWVRDDPVGTTHNNQPVQPSEDHTPPPGTDCFITGQHMPGQGAGYNDIDNGKTTLTSPTFDLSLVQSPRVTYWRWYTNNLGANPGIDWWVVQVSANGGSSWVDLERTTASANYWMERSFLLEDYITPSSQVVFRFIASDEGPGSLVEAAVDDFMITGTMSPVDVAEATAPAVLHLYQARPNPTTGSTIVAFALPEAGPARLEVFDVAGRKVALLADGTREAGLHHVEWDGLTAPGRRAAPGVYFYKLTAGDKTLSQRLVMLE